MLRGAVLVEDRLTVVVRTEASKAWWNQHHPAAKVLTDVREADGFHSIVMLAVKPYQLHEVIQRALSRDANVWQTSLIISVAAGIQLSQLTAWLHSERIVRVMPNTPSLIGCGASGFACAGDVSTTDVEDLTKILSAVGIAEQVSESQLDAVTGVSGSGPAYVFMFIEALADGGVMAGLPRDTAMRLAAQTVLGAARLVQETGDHPGVLKDAVASPGGTTIAAIRSLEHNAFRGAVIDAVLASANRSEMLGKTED
jgi:pyrroline-5-carboxylate reductase